MSHPQESLFGDENAPPQFDAAEFSAQIAVSTRPLSDEVYGKKVSEAAEDQGWGAEEVCNEGQLAAEGTLNAIRNRHDRRAVSPRAGMSREEARRRSHEDDSKRIYRF